MSISVVLFDLGSTLLHFDANPEVIYPLMDQRLLDELTFLGYQLDAEPFLEDFVRMAKDADDLGEETWIEIPTYEIVKTLLSKYGYPHVPEGDIRQALTGFYSVSQEYWKLELDAIPMLKELQRLGYRLGVISNASDVADVQVLLERDGLLGYFEKVWISSSIGVCKPHPEIFAQALEYFQTPAEAIAFIGDTLAADILGADKAGMHSIWITRRADRPENHNLLNKIMPDFQIETLAEVPELLSSILS